MTYPALFHRIVILGTIYTDIFNTTVSMVPTSGGGSLPPATQALCDDVGEYIASWWDNNLTNAPPQGLGFISSARFTGVKVNRIGADGRYEDPEAFEYTAPSPVPGPNSGTYPAQNALVGTLQGPEPRLLAGRGRQFWPPTSAMQTLGSDGRIGTVNATWTAQGLAELYNGLNDVYLANSITSVVGIASNTRAGAFQALDTIRVGRTIDTVRSRRNKIPEDYVELAFG